MIITSKSIIDQYVQSANTLSYSVVAKYEESAFSKYAERFFSYDFCNEIYNTNSEVDEEILTKAKRFIAGLVVNFSVLEWSQGGEVTLSDLGILRTENGESKAAYSNQIKKLENSLESNGNVYLGKLIELIENNAEVFQAFDYENQGAFVERSELIIKSAKEFNSTIRLQNAYLLFPSLLSAQKTAIDFNLFSQIPEDVLNGFINGFEDSNENAEILAKAKKEIVRSIAYFTIQQALMDRLVSVGPAGVYQLSESGSSDYDRSKQADSTNVDASVNFYKNGGNQYLGRCLKILIDAEIIVSPTPYTAKHFIA